MYLIHLGSISKHLRRQQQLFNLNHSLDVIYPIFSKHLNLLDFFEYELPKLELLLCFNLNVLNSKPLKEENPQSNIYCFLKIYKYHQSLYKVRILVNLMLLTKLQKTFYQNQFLYSFLLEFINKYLQVSFRIDLHSIIHFHIFLIFHPTFQQISLQLLLNLINFI